MRLRRQSWVNRWAAARKSVVARSDGAGVCGHGTATAAGQTDGLSEQARGAAFGAPCTAELVVAAACGLLAAGGLARAGFVVGQTGGLVRCE